MAMTGIASAQFPRASGTRVHYGSWLRRPCCASAPAAMMKHRALLYLAMAAFIGACASLAQHPRNQELHLQQYLRWAEAPVDRFTYLGRFYDWQSLSDSQLLVWTSFNEPYLITCTPTVRRSAIHAAHRNHQHRGHGVQQPGFDHPRAPALPDHSDPAHRLPQDAGRSASKQAAMSRSINGRALA